MKYSEFALFLLIALILGIIFGMKPIILNSDYWECTEWNKGYCIKYEGVK
jgi:hypothetical protein